MIKKGHSKYKNGIVTFFSWIAVSPAFQPSEPKKAIPERKKESKKINIVTFCFLWDNLRSQSGKRVLANFRASANWPQRRPPTKKMMQTILSHILTFWKGSLLPSAEPRQYPNASWAFFERCQLLEARESTDSKTIPTKVGMPTIKEPRTPKKRGMRGRDLTG